MSNELLSVLEYMEREKGISRSEMIETITSAMVSAAQKGAYESQDIRIEIHPKTGALKAWLLRAVVDSVNDPANEIHVLKARELKAGIQIGEFIEKEIDPAFLGRIAAQTAKQAIVQQLRRFEKNKVYDDYKDSIGSIVSGVVRRKERGDVVIDLGKSEATLSYREISPGEDFSQGERIRCLLLSIESTPFGPELVLSRSHPQFVRCLFSLEVSEIADGTVKIERLAREAGYRAKIAVSSDDPRIDPVGACVGARGVRVKSIVRELNGEKIDVVRYYEDPVKFLEEAIRPAIPVNVRLDEDERRMSFEVGSSELPVAVGKKGQNARLTSRLLGWRLDIRKQEKKVVGFEQRCIRAVEGLNQLSGIGDDLAKKLVAIGITSPEAFEGVTVQDLVDVGIDAVEAELVIKLAGERVPS